MLEPNRLFVVLVGLIVIVFGQEPARTVVTIVDLTHEVHEDIPRFPLFKPMRRNVTFYGTLEEEGFRSKGEEICVATHYGTHMDAPCHFNQTNWCVADIPLERLILVPAAVIDIRNKVFRNDSVEPDSQLTIEDITNWEEQHGRIPDQSLVLAYTGWSVNWHSTSLFLGTETSDPQQHRHPGLSPKAAAWLVRERPSIYGVGIDAISIDYGRSKRNECHTTLTSHNVYILENLTNLDRLPATGALINIGVMKIGREASGAPARVVATIYSNESRA